MSGAESNSLLAGRYSLEARLGRGGMGEVWRARDTQLEAYVAVKLLDLEVAKPADVERFHDEARSAAQIRSPHVVQVLDHGVDGDRPFIVMELLEGETLRARLTRVRRLSPQDTFRVVQHVGRALVRAHSLGIIHRDLKPENLFIVRNDDEEVIKVLDFGIAKRLARRDELTTGNTVLKGTPSYMSPEQAQPRERVDARTDVWALGVIAFECLCAQCPFDRRSPAATLIAIVRDAAPVPSSLAPLPKAFDAWFARACAKRPDDRFPDVTTMITELRDALGVEGARASMPSVSDGARSVLAHARTERLEVPEPAAARTEAIEVKPARPKRRWLWLLAAALLVTGAIALLALARARSRDKPTTSFVERTPQSSKPGAIAEYREGVQGLHDATIASGLVHLHRATEIDPLLAAAHLRIALFNGGDRDQHFARAMELRPLLDEHERAELDALIPQLKDIPPRPEEAVRRAREATARYPDDAEIWWMLAQLEVGAHLTQDAIEHTARALALDKTFATALWTRANAYEDRGDLDAAKVALDDCIAASLRAASCLRFRADIIAMRGDCDGFLRDAQLLVSLEPTGARAYEYLMRARAARGDLAGAEQALVHASEIMTFERSHFELKQRVRLAQLRGDFAEADRVAEEGERAHADQTSVAKHSTAYAALLEDSWERGEIDHAIDYASTFLAKRVAWIDDPNSAERREDPTMLAAALLLVSGRSTKGDYDKRRAGWEITARALSTIPDLWTAEYGAPAIDASLAKEALAAVTPPVSATPTTWATLGHARMLTGDVDGALPLLRGATLSCLVFDAPIAHTRAHDDLGRALEAKGDARGACAAYKVVLARWGAAPKSITAAHARERVKALACE